MRTGFGEILKKAREEKNLKFADIHKILKIDERYIKALEEEDFSTFEKPIYMKLFLNTYARFLKLNLDEINELFKKGLEENQEKLNIIEANKKKNEKKELVHNTEAKELRQAPPFIFNLNNKTTYFILFGIVASFILIIGVIIYLIGNNNKQKAKIEEGKNIYIVQQQIQNLKITAKAKSNVWMKARYDGKEEDFLLKAGQEKKWENITKIVFLVGNAGGVEFIVNGDTIGTIGEEGEVINGLVFEMGKNWYIDRNQGFKRESSISLKDNLQPTATTTPAENISKEE